MYKRLLLCIYTNFISFVKSLTSWSSLVFHCRGLGIQTPWTQCTMHSCTRRRKSRRPRSDIIIIVKVTFTTTQNKINTVRNNEATAVKRTTHCCTVTNLSHTNADIANNSMQSKTITDGETVVVRWLYCYCNGEYWFCIADSIRVRDFKHLLVFFFIYFFFFNSTYVLAGDAMEAHVTKVLLFYSLPEYLCSWHWHEPRNVSWFRVFFLFGFCSR